MTARHQSSKIAAGVGLVAVVTTLQLMISTTPAELLEASGRAPADVGYKIDATNDGGALRVALYGDVPSERVRRVALVPVALASTDPITAPKDLPLRSPDAGRVLLLTPKVSPGTYKILIPGYRPFGLVSVRR